MAIQNANFDSQRERGLGILVAVRRVARIVPLHGEGRVPGLRGPDESPRTEIRDCGGPGATEPSVLSMEGDRFAGDSGLDRFTGPAAGIRSSGMAVRSSWR